KNRVLAFDNKLVGITAPGCHFRELFGNLPRHNMSDALAGKVRSNKVSGIRVPLKVPRRQPASSVGCEELESGSSGVCCSTAVGGNQVRPNVVQKQQSLRELPDVGCHNTHGEYAGERVHYLFCGIWTGELGNS